jgi:hypothetical protein
MTLRSLYHSVATVLTILCFFAEGVEIGSQYVAQACLELVTILLRLQSY